MLSLITTCKNRLPHLKQTLALMLRQPGAEVIVVDYGCEQGTSAWVREHHPAARLVHVDDDPVFCAARARNLGAKRASGDVLCFIEADVLLQLEFGRWLELNQKPDVFYTYPAHKGPELAGFLIVDRESFLKIGGYDEAIRGWEAKISMPMSGLQESGFHMATICVSCKRMRVALAASWKRYPCMNSTGR